MTGLFFRTCAWLSALTVASACSDGGGDNGEGGTDDGASTSAGEQSGPTSLEGTGTTQPDPDSTEDGPMDVTTEPVPECGNGIREDPEQCDDANLDPGD